MRPRARVTRVDDEGIRLLVVGDRPLDVCFDGRRVWTFWTLRDTEPVAGPATGPVRRVPWPRPLLRHLDGISRVMVRDSAGSRCFFDDVVQFGESPGRVEVVNDDGVELGFDKSGKLVPTFAARSGEDIGALLDATEAVLEALQGAGLEPFLAYGTLLGAVREGRVLGHDSDADLGYVSHHSDPVDVIRESFAVQRTLNDQGWPTSRYSGGAFKVSVARGGVTIGLDVFGGFLDHGRLYLMGEVGVPFEEKWIWPLGTARLEGRDLPVPARPEPLLEAMYGPGWKVPDPAFQFTTPPRTIRALDDWFRGTQPGLRLWERRANTAGVHAGERGPSRLAETAVTLARSLGPETEVLDVGAGWGPDAAWVAEQGVPVVAYDFVLRGLDRALERARRRGAPLRVRHLNLCEWRSVYAEGARLAHDPRPRVVVARHVLDATSATGREAFARLCSMALREGGVVLADIHLPEKVESDDLPARAAWMVGTIDPDALTRLFQQAGATRVTARQLSGRRRVTIRVEGEWSRGAEVAATRG